MAPPLTGSEEPELSFSVAQYERSSSGGGSKSSEDFNDDVIPCNHEGECVDAGPEYQLSEKQI
jgi:hypothetical protein